MSGITVGELAWAELPKPSLPHSIYDGQHWEGRQIVRDASAALADVRFFNIYPDEQAGFWHIYAMVCGTRNGSYKDCLKKPVSAMAVPYYFSSWGLVPSLVLWAVADKLAVQKPAEKPKRHDQPSVYFIVSDESQTVKIGWAYNPEKRRRELQTGSPFTLRIATTVTGGQGEEAKLHRRFAHLRIRSDGEWFYLKDELAAHLEELATEQN